MEILVAALLIVAVPLGLGQIGVMDSILSPGEVRPVDFATLQLPTSPNTYLVAPAGVAAATPHESSPIFEIPVADLKARLLAVVQSEKRTSQVWQSSDGLELQFVQRTALVRFPDVISVKLIGLDGNRSTLAIYSRSVYGYSDVGVNKARVRRWLAALSQ